MSRRPYNHPDNIDQNGQPKVSENIWDMKEDIRLGATPVAFGDNKLLEWMLAQDMKLDSGNAEAGNMAEVVELISKLTRKLDSFHPDAFSWNGDADGAKTVKDALAALADSVTMFYIHPGYWAGTPKTAAEAINRLAAAVYVLQSNTTIS
jgi:hypothetical protein